MPDQTSGTSIHEIRRANLFLLLREFSEKQIALGAAAKGIESAFAHHINVSQVTLSHLKTSRNISDKVAAQIEVRGGREPGWLSIAHELDTVTPAQQAFEALAVSAWKGGNAKERRRLMQLAKSGFSGV